MCTSFVLYSDKTYIGMNFDISDRPIALSLKGNDQFIVLQQDGPSFYPAFGLNKSGTFMNLQMVEPIEAGKYRRGKDCLHIMKLFEGILSGQIGADSLERLSQEKTIVNVPNMSVHSLVVGENHSACVIEPGRPMTQIKSSGRDFLSLTNFPLADFANVDYSQVTGAGAERYKTCQRMLWESERPFSVNRGFAILEETMQSAGDFPTQLSLLAVPDDACFYFTVRRNFRKRFKFSFADCIVRTDEGFARQQNHALDKKRILLSEFEQ